MPDSGEPQQPWRNEGTKLLATALNNLAVATVVAGVIVPAVGLIYRLQSAPKPSWGIVWVGLAWLAAGAILHLLAQLVLRTLRP